MKGRAYRDRGNYDNAIKDFQAALKYAPNEITKKQIQVFMKAAQGKKKTTNG